MKIILLEDVENIGRKGEIKEVKNGLARNFLIPKKLAIIATSGNIKTAQDQLQSQKNKDVKILDDAREIGTRLENLQISIPVKVGEEDKLFGSVTSQNISDLLNEKGFEISKKDIVLDDPIKSLGNFDIPIKLHPELTVNIKLDVVKEIEPEGNWRNLIIFKKGIQSILFIILRDF